MDAVALFGDHLMTKNTNNNAIFISTGLTLECSLKFGDNVGYGDVVLFVKRIAMIPFSQEWEIAISYFGHALRVKGLMVGPLEDNYLWFSSKKDTAIKPSE